MAQTRVNGAVASDQFLTGELTHFILDEVDGASNVASFGYSAGVANKGEEAVNLIQTVANPVIINASNARILHFAVETPGITASSLQTAVRLGSSFANATVTAGTYAVV